MTPRTIEVTQDIVIGEDSDGCYLSIHVESSIGRGCHTPLPGALAGASERTLKGERDE